MKWIELWAMLEVIGIAIGVLTFIIGIIVALIMNKRGK